LIVGRDLNFTMNRMEVWGNLSRVDRLVEFLIHQIERVGLVDVKLISLMPTWKNNRISSDGVSKILDVFFFFSLFTSVG
jgi:hypothetical protein